MSILSILVNISYSANAEELFQVAMGTTGTSLGIVVRGDDDHGNTFEWRVETLRAVEKLDNNLFYVLTDRSRPSDPKLMRNLFKNLRLVSNIVPDEDYKAMDIPVRLGRNQTFKEFLATELPKHGYPGEIRRFERGTIPIVSHDSLNMGFRSHPNLNGILQKVKQVEAGLFYGGDIHLAERSGGFEAALERAESDLLSQAQPRPIEPASRKPSVETPIVFQPEPKHAQAPNAHPETETDAPSSVSITEFTRNLSAEVRAGKIDPIVGRDDVVQRVFENLRRRTKPVAMLVGDAGVGKTAIAERIAQLLVEGKGPDMLQSREVLVVSVGNLVAGTKFRGSFEDRIKVLIQNSGKYLYLFDEAHALANAGKSEGGPGAGELLKEAMGRGEITAILATTLDEKDQLLKDKAIARRVGEPIVIAPNSHQQKVAILKAKMQRNADHYVEGSRKLVTTPGAIEAAVVLSERVSGKAADYFQDAFEGTASMVMEEFRTGKRKNTRMTDRDVARFLRRENRMDVASLDGNEASKLLNIESLLKEQVVGQDDAIATVAKAIRLQRSRQQGKRGPTVILTVGPTGTGKTYSAEKVGEILGLPVKVVDGNTFGQDFATSSIGGAPAGYVGYDEGGQITEMARREPRTLFIWDEIDKASPKMLEHTMQIFDKGSMTDNHGRPVDFSNTIIWMNANSLADLIAADALETDNPREFGFVRKNGSKKRSPVITDEKVRELLVSHLGWRPEIVNRIGTIAVFKPHTDATLKSMLPLELAKIKEEFGVELEYADGAEPLLLEKLTTALTSSGQRDGGRALKRALTVLTEPLAMAKLEADAATRPGKIAPTKARRFRVMPHNGALRVELIPTARTPRAIGTTAQQRQAPRHTRAN